MFVFELKNKAAKDVDKLPATERKRILKKLKFYANQENPLVFAEKLTDYRFGEYRFRIGDYRVIFDVADRKVTILKIGHRKDIYKDC